MYLFMYNDNHRSISPCIAQVRTIVFLSSHPFVFLNMDYRSDLRIAADEYCSVLQLNRKLQMEGATIFAELLGVDIRDRTYLSPDGQDCTRRCESSLPGSDFWDDGFCRGWTLAGWVLEPPSWNHLQTVARRDMFRALKKKMHRFSNSRCFQKKKKKESST